MSTRSIVTIKTKENTFNLYRHSDGYLGHWTAEQFFNMFENKAHAKGGVFDRFLANNCGSVQFESIGFVADPFSKFDCEYHYALNADTNQLVVTHCDFDDNRTTVFNGSVIDYVNKYSEDENMFLLNYNTSDYSQRFVTHTKEQALAVIKRALSYCQSFPTMTGNASSSTDEAFYSLKALASTPVSDSERDFMQLAIKYIVTARHCFKARYAKADAALEARFDEMRLILTESGFEIKL